MSGKPEIILYHYPTSPYARRVVWYLNLRGIPYSQCMQPVVMPRPDVAAIGTAYRRIPLMAIGRDIYNDTRLIISTLEKLYPSSSPSSPYRALSSPAHRGLERLFESWAVDGGVFVRAAQLIPVDSPALRDARFRADRKEMTGRSFEPEMVLKMRPEALVEMRAVFEMVEGLWLGDGREWILGTEGPSLADVEAVWPLHWLTTMPGALPTSLISPSQFPKTFAWISRFQKTVKEAATRAGKPRSLTGSEAAQLVSSSDFAEPEGSVDSQDPTGLQKGELVEVMPIDSGFTRKDRGALVALDGREIVVASATETGTSVRVHAPRHGFRVKRAGGAKI